MLFDLCTGGFCILLVCVCFTMNASTVHIHKNSRKIIDEQCAIIAAQRDIRLKVFSPTGKILDCDIYMACIRYAEWRSVWIHGPLQFIVEGGEKMRALDNDQPQ